MPDGHTSADALDAAMARLADGDRSALDLVYRSLWPVVVRFCTKLTGDPVVAEDLAQGALLKLFEQAHDYDPTKRAQSWALSIAAWECRTYRQARSRSERNVVKMQQRAPEESSPDLEEQVWRGEALAALEELVDEMPAEDREALVDSFVRGLSEPVHRKRKQRVLARLRRRWQEIHGGD